MKRLRSFLLEWADTLAEIVTLILTLALVIAPILALASIGLHFAGMAGGIVFPLLFVTGLSAWLNSSPESKP